MKYIVRILGTDEKKTYKTKRGMLNYVKKVTGDEGVKIFRIRYTESVELWHIHLSHHYHPRTPCEQKMCAGTFYYHGRSVEN